jgi:hypothetical protein
MTVSVGAPHWMAPEFLTGDQTYDEKVDVSRQAGSVEWVQAGADCCPCVHEGLRPSLRSLMKVLRSGNFVLNDADQHFLERINEVILFEYFPANVQMPITIQNRFFIGST